MKVKELLVSLKTLGVYGKVNSEILSLTAKHTDVKKGSLFFAIKGETHDGHKFISDAISMGCVAIVCEKLPANYQDISVCFIVVESCREAMSLIAASFYKNVSKEMLMLAVTGTNGKTTTTYLVKSILEAAKHKVGLIGTSANYIGQIQLPPTLTTPDPIDPHALLFKMKEAGVTAVVMEASAHAIFYDKLVGINFDCVNLTNLTQDHLDFFKTIDKYKETKKSFFEKNYANKAVVNVDDKLGEEIYDNQAITTYSYSYNQKVDCYAKNIKLNETGTEFTLSLFNEETKISLNLPGKFNVLNCLGAACMCAMVGIDIKTIAKGISNLASVSGRFNVVETSLGFNIVIDYAHSPDGILNVLSTIKEISSKKLVVVFGCGGNRDKTKRPIMGKIASKLADETIITSDNPRFENPESIINEIETGINKKKPYKKIVNREEAIFEAISQADTNTIVAVLGKGAEDYQEINGIKHRFSDEDIVLKCVDRIYSKGKEKKWS